MPILKRIANSNILKRLVKSRLCLRADQRGFSLMETLLALGILGAVGVAFMQGVGAISATTDMHDGRITASNLAQAQIEEIKAAAYDGDGDYSVSVTEPVGYSVTIDVTAPEIGLQQVTVQVHRDGAYVLEITTFKMDR